MNGPYASFKNGDGYTKEKAESELNKHYSKAWLG